MALKRLKLCSVSTNESFIHEIEVIASVRHINLLSIIGYCQTDGHSAGCERIIVCDLMSNGSLYHHLFGPRTNKLSWAHSTKDCNRNSTWTVLLTLWGSARRNS